MLRIDKSMNEDVIVLSLQGQVMNLAESEMLRDELHALKEDGFNRVVMDLGDIYLVNSEGIGTFLAGLSGLRTAGGDLMLGNLSSRAADIFVLISHLDNVFEIYDTVDEAVSQFRTRATTA